MSAHGALWFLPSWYARAAWPDGTLLRAIRRERSMSGVAVLVLCSASEKQRALTGPMRSIGTMFIKLASATLTRATGRGQR